MNGKKGQRAKAEKNARAELAAIRDEVNAADVAADEKQEAADVAAAESAGASEEKPAVMPLTRDGLTLIAQAGVKTVGTFACRRAKVTPLEAGEIKELADAVADVCVAYGWDKIDPKIAAWLALGMVTQRVAMDRKPLAPASAPAKPKPEEKPAAAPAAPASAVDDQAAYAKVTPYVGPA